MIVWLIMAALVQSPAPVQGAAVSAPVPQAAPAAVTIAETSLFSKEYSSLDQFKDQKARHVGDILTIQVVENASASNSANTNTKKDGASGAPGLFGSEKGPLTKLLAGTSSLSFGGQGATTRSGNLQAAISVRVEEVLPNGDLFVEGAKEVMVNSERQMLRIRGLVRLRDITPGNMVMSTSIANMDVRFDGKGVVSDINKPGWLYKFFSKVLPF